MREEKIKRINELAKKSKREGLSPAELAEQAKLRQEYIESVKASLKGQLENTYVLRPDGSKERLLDIEEENAAPEEK